jgi:hypothetical protein
VTEPAAPRLTHGDAWIVAALCEAGRDWPVRLRDLIHNADWLNRAILTFDEVSYGLPRLEAAGLVEVTPGADGPRVRPTKAARGLRKTIKADTLGGVLAGAAAAVGAPPYPEPESEDRTLGRLTGLDETLWRAEVAAYRRAFRADAATLAAGGFAVLAGIVAAAVAVAKRRRRR